MLKKTKNSINLSKVKCPFIPSTLTIFLKNKNDIYNILKQNNYIPVSKKKMEKDL